jgi:hypothetical protein
MEEFLKMTGAFIAAMAIWSVIDLFVMQGIEARFKV